MYRKLLRSYDILPCAGKTRLLSCTRRTCKCR